MSPIRLPSLNALRAFDAAARHLSFVRAADELCLTQGAISLQIRQLEEMLGHPLFERRNRAVFLTRAGLRLQEVSSDVLRRLEQGMREFQAPAHEQPLVVSCEPTIAMRWLIPKLASFHQAHPAVQIHLLAAGGEIDFSACRVDLALRRNDFAWRSEYHAEVVGREWVAPVCQPGLAVAGQGDLNALCRLHTLSRPSAWEDWHRCTGRSDGSDPAWSKCFEHFYLSLQAAASGLGVAMASVYMVESEMLDGRLAAPFGFVEDGSEYILLSAEPFSGDARRQAFLAWIRQSFNDSASLLIADAEHG